MDLGLTIGGMLGRDRWGHNISAQRVLMGEGADSLDRDPRAGHKACFALDPLPVNGQLREWRKTEREARCFFAEICC